MATLTNSEGRVSTYTNELLETSLLQLNSPIDSYTTGEHNTIFIKTGSNNALLLDHTYHINRHIFRNYTINEHTINDYTLEFICLNGTSNEYDLQPVYNNNDCIGVITELSCIFSDIRYPDRIGYIYRFRKHLYYKQPTIIEFPNKNK